MAFAYYIDQDEGLGIVTLDGSVSVEEFLQVMGLLYRDPAWQPGFNALWDCRQIEDVHVSLPSLRALLADSGQPQEGLGGRAAFVMAREVNQSMAKLLILTTRTGLRERRTFELMEHARAWLAGEGTA